MNRIDRLTAILLTIQARKAISADELADKYGVSKRTVYRDVKALVEAGVPIYQEDDKKYRTMEGYYLPPLMVSREEAMALLITEKLVAKYMDSSLLENLSSLATKIRAVLRYADKEYLEDIDNNVRVYTATGQELGYGVTDSLMQLQQAIAAKKLIELNYNNAKGEITERVIEPVGITQYGLGWHLIGWCRYRKEYRDFRIDRITDFKVLDEVFEYRDKDPLNTYLVKLSENKPGRK